MPSSEGYFAQGGDQLIATSTAACGAGA